MMTATTFPASNLSSKPEAGRYPISPAERQRQWERAYLSFETPEQEIRKFLARLEWAGVRDWPRDAEVVELFCGRGNGLRALDRLGFTRLEGVDLSAALVSQYTGPVTVSVGDCRSLPFEDSSKDILIVQGGLHHLPDLRSSLPQTVSEMHRVLRKAGRVFVVEPWNTPFLRWVTAVAALQPVRRVSRKIDSFMGMVEWERETYLPWLNDPVFILQTLDSNFEPERRQIGWGKLKFVGRPRELLPTAATREDEKP